MDFATLGVAVKQDGTLEAVRDLEKLVAVAPKAEKAVDSLNKTARDSAATAYAKTIDRATASLRGFDAIAAKAAQQAAYATRELSSITMRDLRGDDIAAYGREMDALRAKFNPLFAASKQYEASLDEINRAHTLGAISAQEQGAAIMRLDAQYESAARAANGLAAANKSMAGSFHTTNLMFQAQDVAMMTALGQAPFALAMQQGPQVTGIMHQLGNGRQAIQALGGAIMGLINPLSIATIAVIGLGAAGVQAAMSWVSGMTPVRRSMEEHREWLSGLLKGYDDLDKAVGDYIDKAIRLPASLARLDVTAELNKDIERLRVVQSIIDDFNIRPDAAIQLPWQSLNEDLAVLREIKSQFDAGLITAVQFAEQLELLSMNDRVDDQARALAGGLRGAADEAAELEVKIESGRMTLLGLTTEAQRAAQAMATLNGTFALLNAGAGQHGGLQNILDGQTEALENLKGMIPDIRTAQQRAAEELATALTNPSELFRNEAQAAYDLFMKNTGIMDARRAAEKASKQRDPYADLIRGAQDFIASQAIEQQALNMTAEAAQRLRFEQDLLNRAANDNIKLTPTMRDELSSLAAQMAATEAQTKMLTQAANDNAALWGQAQDGVSSIIKTWARGGDVLDAFSDKLGQIGDMLIDMAVRDLFANAFGGGMGGGGGNIFGGIMDWLGGLFGGNRATGGPVEPGKIYRVNENTPNSEWFAPSLAGTILPNHAVSTGGGASTITYGDLQVTIGSVVANSEAEGAAAARGFQREMQRWQNSGEGKRFVRDTMQKMGRAN